MQASSRVFRSVAASVALVVASGGCEQTATAPPAVASVRVDPARDTIRVGESVQLQAEAIDADGRTVASPLVSWSSSAPELASVDSQGVVTGRAPGVARIAATVQGVDGSAEITVEERPAVSCTPGSGRPLEVGQAIQLSGAETETICFAAGDARAEYVAIPFNASETGGATVAIDVTGGGIVGVTGPPNPARVAGDRVLAESESAAAVVGGAASWERRFREREIRELEPLIPRARTAMRRLQADRIAADVPSVGSLMRLNVSTSCSREEIQTGRVEYVSDRAIIVSDTANPSGGFTEADYRDVGERFDTLVYVVDVENFGEPTDLDDNQRVIIFYTRAVNELTPADADFVIGGFFWAGDLFPESECGSSNVAEIFYMLAPDPLGKVNGNQRSVEMVKRQTVGTTTHEFQHLINAARRIYVNDADALEEVWLNEGLSHIAEELLFYHVSGLAPRMNLSLDDLRASQRILDAVNFYQVSNLRRYRSYLVHPDTVSLMGVDQLPTRGAIWAFLRYAADRVNASDPTFFHALVNATLTGLANLAHVLPAPPIDWMQDWTVAVYADDAVPGVQTEYVQPSWDFRSVVPALDPDERFPLRVTELKDESEVRFRVLAGGAAFLRFGVAAGGAATLDARVGGITPPSNVRISVMRTK